MPESLDLPDALLQSPSFQIERIRRATKDTVETELTKRGTTMREFWVLTCTMTHAASQTQLSELLAIDASDMVRLIDSLETHGWVARERDAKDQRNLALALTVIFGLGVINMGAYLYSVMGLDMSIASVTPVLIYTITGAHLIMLAGAILGSKRGALSVLLFLALLAIGLPLLSGGRGGLGVFAGPSVGYLVGFPVAAWLVGRLTEMIGRPYRVPLGIMANVLGGSEPDLPSTLLHSFARDRRLRVQLYGKEVKPGRKVGHVTTYGDDLAEVRKRARHAAGYLMGDPDA